MTSDENYGLGTGEPQAARMYNYYLGGKDNYLADAETAEKLREAFPTIRTAARENRAFMHRAVHFLAAETGIRQFFDIGTGIPAEPNLHQVAQAVDPTCRVIYVDNDPIVRAHAQALMTGTPEGRATFIEADARDPEAILNAPELKETLDLSKPVALSLISVLPFIPDKHGPYDIVDRLLSALCPGSALVITHWTGDFASEAIRKGGEIYHKKGIEVQERSKAEVERFFTGLELVEPGIEVLHRWRPDNNGEAAQAGSPQVTDADVSAWAGVALKR